MPIMIRKTDQQVPQWSNAVLVGAGLELGQDTEGLPVISTTAAGGEAGNGGEVVISPAGDGTSDRQAIQDALWNPGIARVRLGPGDFRLDGTLLMKEGKVLTGTDMDMTRLVKDDFSGAAIGLGDGCQWVTIENLALIGPSAPSSANTGLTASRSPGQPPVARHINLRNLRIDGFNTHGVEMREVSEVDLSCLLITNIGASGLQLAACSAVRVGAVRVASCGGMGIALIEGCESIALVAVEVEASGGGFHISTSYGVTLQACVARVCSAQYVHIIGGGFHTITSFVADEAGIFNDVPFLQVDNGAAGVVVASFHRISAGAHSSEVNVSTASGRVLVGAHDFDPLRINSGGNFVEISGTAL